MRLAILLFIVGLIFALAPALVKAAAANDVYLAKGVVHEGNFYARGNTVEIAGAVTGDVITAAKNLIIKGPVGGDIIAVASNVRVLGPVGGNIRVMGGNVDIFSTVERNLMVASGNLVLAETADIGGQVTIATGTADIRGKIKGSLLAGVGSVIIAGTIEGPINLYLEKKGILDIRETANTSSSFNYYSQQPARIAVGAQLTEEPKQFPLPVSSKKQISWWRYLISLFSALVLGMVLVTLIPRKFEEIISEALTNPWRSLVWGILWALLAPLAIIILMITVIGFPLAIILLLIYFIGLILAPIVAGASLGWYFKSYWAEGWLGKINILWITLLGIFIYRSIVFLPFVGSLVGFLGAIWAWGAIMSHKNQMLKYFR